MGLTILGPHDPKSPSAPIIGIDLGTTFSLSAFMTPEGPKLVRDSEGDARVPSAIAFGSDGKVTIGWEARRRAIADPTHVAFSIKRLIGRTMADLEKELPYVPYQVVEREESSGRKVLHVRIDNHEHTPEELSALVLKELVARTTAALGQPIQKAVITVPAYFDEGQRQATRDAGRIAGLDVLRIVNEPTAAALAYGLQEKKEGLVAVYDFGGGTFDCSILQLQGGVFKVLSTHGDTHLGGDDIDVALMKRLRPELSDADPQTLQQLRDRAERIKIELSSKETADDGGISRIEFESLIGPLVERTINSCKAALRDAKLNAQQIDEVVLVGGSSRIPFVRRRVQELFGRVPHTELNPDEVVAMGAAVQASILSGQLRQILLLDITPLSLGIETMGGAVSRLIARNSTIPAQATERYTTFVDNQTGVDLHILQGERELAKDCRSLGKFNLTGIPPMPAGLPQIDVTFLIDANGMLQVTAKELRSGVSAGIEVQPSHGLSRNEVERMIRESLEHAKADFEARKLANLQTKADANLRHTEKGLASAGQRLSSDQRQAIDDAVLAVKAALNGSDVASLQKSLDDLDAATAPLAELLMNTVLAAEVVHKKLSDV